MRGHQPLIERRLRGWKTDAVFVADVGLDALGCWRNWLRWATHAHVELEPSDRMRRMDARFAYGLTVHLDAADAQRLQGLADVFMQAGAERVVGVVSERRGDEVRAVQMLILERDGRRVEWLA